MAPPRYSKETIKYWNERILAQISNQRKTRRRNAEKIRKRCLLLLRRRRVSRVKFVYYFLAYYNFLIYLCKK